MMIETVCAGSNHYLVMKVALISDPFENAVEIIRASDVQFGESN